VRREAVPRDLGVGQTARSEMIAMLVSQGAEGNQSLVNLVTLCGIGG